MIKIQKEKSSLEQLTINRVLLLITIGIICFHDICYFESRPEGAQKGFSFEKSSSDLSLLSLLVNSPFYFLDRRDRKSREIIGEQSAFYISGIFARRCDN